MSANPTVLHVDDDADNRQSLGWVLRAEGFRVIEAGTGAEALHVLARDPPDLIVLDVRLPDMSGFEVCRLIKADPHTAFIPVLQLSGHFVEPKDRVQGLETGADAYLMKPVEPRELIAHLRALLRVYRAERTLRAIIESSPNAVLVFDAHGRIRQDNVVAQRLFGHPVGTLAGQPVASLIPCPLLPEDGVGLPPVSVTARRHDGSTFAAEVTIAAMRLEPERLFTAFVRDLTERNRLEEQLRQAVKMEAIGRLAGGVAHDFNNQLTVINGYAELLLAELPANDPSREFLDEIRRSGAHAAELTSQLLAFGRKQRQASRVINLNTSLDAMGKMLRRLLGADVELVTDLEPALGAVRADASQVEQVVMNLAVNARDAMPRGGRLAIRTRNVAVGPTGTVSHATMVPGRYVALEISDTGVGMSDAVRARVFEPFFTTKETGKGTGLGLATVYGIVQQSGGQIDVQTAVGQGTTFRVYLPRVDQAESAAVPAGPAPIPRGTETILLVDDEAGVRGLGALILRSCGYTVLPATDADDAQRQLRAYAGPIHLLVTDVVMPHVSGPELASRLRPARPDMRVLFMSGYSDDAVLPADTAAAGIELLSKPFNRVSLATKVREVLNGARQ